jgi:hypothetical protein
MARFSNRILGLLLLLLPAGAWAQDWSQAQSCIAHAPSGSVRRFAVRESEAASEGAFCLRLAGGIRVCARPTQRDSANVAVTWPGHAVRSWQAEVLTYGDTAGVEAFLTDLDADGAPDLGSCYTGDHYERHGNRALGRCGFGREAERGAADNRDQGLQQRR